MTHFISVYHQFWRGEKTHTRKPHTNGTCRILTWLRMITAKLFLYIPKKIEDCERGMNIEEFAMLCISHSYPFYYYLFRLCANIYICTFDWITFWIVNKKRFKCVSCAAYYVPIRHNLKIESFTVVGIWINVVNIPKIWAVCSFHVLIKIIMKLKCMSHTVMPLQRIAI